MGDSVILSDCTEREVRILSGNQPAQSEFLADFLPGWSAMSGGWGSGKTWAGARKFLVLHLLNKCPGMVVAPTTEGLWLLCVPELVAACEQFGVEISTHPHGRGERKKPHLMIQGQPVWLFSAEAPESITGVEVGHVWCDEYARYPAAKDNPLRNASLQIRGRLRHKLAKVLHGCVTSTPEGIDTPLQLDFADPKTRKPDHRNYVAQTRDNAALPAGYIESLKGSIPAELVDQYLAGIAVSYVADRAHPTFSLQNIADLAWDARLPLHLGADYNVSPMCWVAAQIHGEEVWVLDEVVMEDFSQVDMAMHAAHDRGWGAFFVKLHPDRSAKARSTTGDSEFVTMCNTAKSLKWRYTGSAHGANPGINARINLLSRMILDARGVRRLRIHPRCKHLLDDLRFTGRAASGYNPGPQGKRGHILDALGYLVWDECRPGQAITSLNL